MSMFNNEMNRNEVKELVLEMYPLEEYETFNDTTFRDIMAISYAEFKEFPRISKFISDLNYEISFAVQGAKQFLDSEEQVLTDEEKKVLLNLPESEKAKKYIEETKVFNEKFLANQKK